MTKMTGARFLAETLAGYGITHNFMVPAVLRRTLAEMERCTGIVSIHTHGEQSAAYMADGYARAARRPGLCMAQQVGALNLASGLRDAWLGHSPVIAFTGGPPRLEKRRVLHQDADDIRAFEPYTKWNASVNDVARFPDMVRQAFREATTGCPGPVHLQIEGQEGELDRDEGEFTVRAETDFAAVPPFRPAPDARRIKNAIARIRRAERPVIVAGGGVRWSDAGEELRRFAEAMQVPVATSLNGKDSIPGNHPLAVGVPGTYSRKCANRVIAEADLVVFIGSDTGSMTTNFWRLPPPATAVIQIDINAPSLGRNYLLEIAILADAKIALAHLLEAAKEAAPMRRNAWLERAQTICREWREEYAPLLESDDVPIRPERICSELTRLMPDNAILAVDTGHAAMWMGGMFDLTSTRQDYIRCMGHLGWAFPAGLGAKCACPDRPVIAFTGDLGFWYNIAEIETAVRWRINSVTVVNNNRSGNQSKRGFSIAYEGEPTERSRELWVHNKVDFAAIAQSIGALGIRVERPGEFEGAFLRALESDRPAIIDVATDIEAMAPLAWDEAAWARRY